MSQQRQVELDRLISEAKEVIKEAIAELETCESPLRRRILRQDIHDSTILQQRFEDELKQLRGSNSESYKTENSKSALAKTSTPEKEELERKKAELASLESQLIQRELDLTTLQSELSSFERLYLKLVGSLYVQLDEFGAQSKEELARIFEKDVQKVREAAEARHHAKTSADTMDKYKALSGSSSAFKPQENHQKLYRQIAKLVHPDLAIDEKDRQNRTDLMARVNKAYSAGDIDQLKKILHDWERSPEAITGSDTAAELVRVLRKIAQITERIRKIETEIESLKASNLFKLKAQVNQAREAGRDLLAEMANIVKQQIVEARSSLETLKKESVRK